MALHSCLLHVGGSTAFLPKKIREKCLISRSGYTAFSRKKIRKKIGLLGRLDNLTCSEKKLEKKTRTNLVVRSELYLEHELQLILEKQEQLVLSDRDQCSFRKTTTACSML